MTPLVVILMALVLSVAIEGTVEALFGQPIDLFKKLTPYKSMILTYISLAVGVFFTITYKVDLIYAVISIEGADAATIQPTLPGFIITGLIIGRGSKAVHDFLTNVLGKKKDLVVGETIYVDAVNKKVPAQ
jgi:hypothetical protein